VDILTSLNSILKHITLKCGTLPLATRTLSAPSIYISNAVLTFNFREMVLLDSLFRCWENV
jgi:hypothetical protein